MRKRVMFILVLSVVVILIGLRLALHPIMTGIVNRKLDRLLATEVEVEKLGISIFRGKVEVKGIMLGESSAEERPFFRSDVFSVDIDLFSLFRDTLVVERMLLKGGDLNLVKANAGSYNFPELQPREADARKPVEKREPGKSVKVENLDLRDCRLAYTDKSSTNGVVSLVLEELEGEGKNLLLNPPAGEDVARGSLELTGIMPQDGAEPARIGVSSSSGPLGEGIPDLDFILCLVGFELDQLASWTPPGTKTVLGGSNIDLNIDTQMSESALDMDLRVESAGGFSTMHIAGTPRKPVIPTSGLLLSILARSGGSLGQITQHFGGTGIKAVTSAWETGKTFAGGAAKTAGSIGGGLLGIVKGVGHASFKEMGAGFTEGYEGAVEDFKGTVTGTAGSLGTGFTDTMKMATGSKSSSEWDQDSAARWERKWQDARDELTQLD